ncbi:hypothetical protein PPYR_04054 [Photinus pyralis]|uniref:Uncharacterized protein n=1 Tax=Photinus pyralis TaxID=7054 RepID=A0A5N4AX82_PHOPY|nr:hypothetical protein PPYR_04054 [Photinus pyralis]
MWALINSHKNNAVEPNTTLSCHDFNLFFSTVTDSVLNLKSDEYRFDFKCVPQVDTRDAIKGLRNSKSRDIHGLSITLIKRNVSALVEPITKLANMIIKTGIFPDTLKIALVIPHLKKGLDA